MKKNTKFLWAASIIAITCILGDNGNVLAQGSLPSKGYIDGPTEGSTITGQASVSGWALDESSVSKIEILVDGQTMGTAQYGLSRPDVDKAFPQFKNASSGYQYTLDTTTLTNGKHTITIRETNKNGNATDLSNQTVNVQNSVGYIDQPSDGSAIDGQATVSGWFLDKIGVSKVEILVDGQTMGTAHYGLSRPDVDKVLPQFQNKNSGYQYTLDTTKLSNGKHAVSVKETNNNGEITVVNCNVNVQNAAPIGYLDQPAEGSAINGQIPVSGWFLDGSGVSQIEVLIDGQAVGTAQYGLSRSDVEKAFPKFQNASSGYNYLLDTSNLTNGKHTLTVREIGNNGNATVLSNQTVNVQNLSVIGYIDHPEIGSSINGQTSVSGWFQDKKGVSKIEVLVDGQTVGDAQYGLSRSDVDKVFPQFQNGNAGYQYTLDTTKLSNGKHSIAVKEINNNGEITVLDNQTVNVKNATSSVGYIDQPAKGSSIYGQATVSGWFLDGLGVSKIEVLVDGQTVGDAQYGSSRPDVDKAFPEFQNGNAGYQYTLDTTKLSNGQHTITVRETSKNGNITSLDSQTVNVQNATSVMGSIDQPALGSSIYGGITVSGWFLDGTGVSQIEILVDGQTIGTAQYGLSRPDVAKVFPQYQNGNSGYQYYVNLAPYANGQHTLTVKETGKNGSINTIQSKFTVTTPPVVINPGTSGIMSKVTSAAANYGMTTTTNNDSITVYKNGTYFASVWVGGFSANPSNLLNGEVVADLVIAAGCPLDRATLVNTVNSVMASHTTVDVGNTHIDGSLPGVNMNWH